MRGGLKHAGNYMEACPSDGDIYVNAEWLKRLLRAKAPEMLLHNHLLFIKGLHEIAHLLTPKFLQWCESKEPVEPVTKRKRQGKTPPKIGTKGKGMKMGDRGYGLEEALSGGRLFHIQANDRNTACALKALVIKRKVTKKQKMAKKKVGTE